MRTESNFGKRGLRTLKRAKAMKKRAWISEVLLTPALCFSLRSGGGGARAELEKTCFRSESIAFLAGAPFGALRRRSELQDKLPTETQHDGEAKNKRERSKGKHRT